ncbi:MAG: helix-turn-helix domain-containing protein [Lachnospiraceae bacterium]|nr:helix-turn-helix domain-containing protein [Lachnospiraceae bacterium]
MGEYLPGNLRERLRELREAHGYKTRQELAEVLGVNKSTYGRFESGETKTVSSEMLIKLAKLYNVTTDYILGLSDVPEQTYYDIGALGLSVQSATNLLNNKANRTAVDRLLRNEKFLTATQYIGTYFDNTFEDVVMKGNSLYDFSFDLTTDYLKTGKIPRDKDINDLRKTLKENKVQPEPYQLTRIQNQVMAAVKEIKRQLSAEGTDLTDRQLDAEVLKNVKDEIDKLGDLSQYSYEEKKQFVIEAVKTAVKQKSDYSEEIAERVDKTIEIMLGSIIDVWKKD